MIKVNAKQLEIALGIANEIIPARTTMDAFRYVLVRCTGTQVAITASDGSMGATTMVDCEGTCPEMLIDASRLKSVCSGYEEISMTLQQDTVEVKAGKGKFKLPSYSAMTFPEKQIDDRLVCELSGNEIKKAINSVAPFMDNEEVRTKSGIKMVCKDGRIEFVACKSTGIGYYSNTVDHAFDAEVVISKKELRAIKSVCTGNVKIGATKFDIERESNGASAWFATDRTRLWVSGLVGSYPRHGRFVSIIDDAKKFPVSIPDLLQMVQHANLVTDMDSRAISIKAEGGQLHVSSSSKERGSFSSFIDFEQDARFEIMVDGTFLSSTLQAYKESASIGCEGDSAIVLADGYTKAMIMGMKI